MQRFSHVILSTALLAMIVAGCGRRNVAEPAAEPTAGAKDAPASQPTLKSPTVTVDQEVMQVVLGDLLASTDSPLARRDSPPAEIRLAAQPAKYPRTVATILLRHDKKQWAALSPHELTAATEAAEALVRRHQRGDDFGPLKPIDPRIKIEPDPTTAPAATANADRAVFGRPVHVYPPGYSSDGSFAVVALSIPWSIHHADATYILARDEQGGWRIILRQFVYYC